MDSIIFPKERVYFVLCIVLSILVYLGLILSIVGIAYILIGVLIGLITHGIFIGRLRGNGIRITEYQFPEVYSIARDLSQRMGLESIPAMYIINSDGIFNAFATKFLGRNFVVIFSDVLELAYEQGESALSFVISHELAHIKRKHLSMRWLLYPALAVPLLGQAYSRACEYTCDLHGAFYVSDGAISGLLALAAGKKLYKKVNLAELVKQSYNESDFWVWLAELFSTHPNLTKRIRLVQNCVISRNNYISHSKQIPEVM